MSSEQPHKFSKPSQLDLGLGQKPEPDRNHRHGGRSFYFFDLDDNVLHLPTPIFVYRRDNDEEIALSTGAFARVSGLIGKPGLYENYFVNGDDQVGSFRRFRDRPISDGAEEEQSQPFVEDMAHALNHPDFQWKGPSWECFHYAVFNQRPISLITARGHHPETIRKGISLLVKAQFLPAEPNYLDIFPVSHPTIRHVLGDSEAKHSIAELKKTAIIRCVESAMDKYGVNTFHRFGMSDDDAHNIKLITEAKKVLKKRYPDNSFFVIHADSRPFRKEEIFCDRIEDSEFEDFNQLELFGAEHG